MIPKITPLIAVRSGHDVVLYHRGDNNHCPRCSSQSWIVGRITAECGRCGTALPLASSGTPTTHLNEKD